MLLPDALTLATRLITTGEKHADYKRTKDLAETYRIYITGCEIEKKLVQFVQREDKILFDQRVLLTQSITPAVASSIRQPYSKVTRNNRVKKAVKVKSEEIQRRIEKMITGFFGSSRKNNRGLDYWMKSRFLELNFIDPNSWVIVEWDTPQSESDIIMPRPFEVSAEQALNYFAVNEEVKWLFIMQKIKYDTKNPNATSGTGMDGGKQGNAEGVVKPADTGSDKKEGIRYTLYDEDYTIVYQQIDPEKYSLVENEVIVKIKNDSFVVRVAEPKIGYAPVLRIGYKRDEVTSGRTYVNPWHDALCYFNKSLKTVSELDLTMCLHTFPQKLQYVQKCEGVSKERKCNNGKDRQGETCSACKGTGYKVHTTAQDAIMLPMPDGKDQMMDLDKLLVYKAPPIELIKFQNEYTQQLEKQAHQAVFNSQVFVKKGNQPGATGQPIQTATEVDYNMQSVYDALEPFTEKFSEVWQDFVTTFGILAGEKIGEITTVHEFPADFKLKTDNILLAERKAATDSGAPAFLIETIDDDLASIIYEGDSLGIRRYRVKRKFYPFSGNTPDEIAELLTSEYVSRRPKVLYSNFDAIFKEIEKDKPEFWLMTNPAAQAEIVEAKLTEFIARLDAEKPTMTVDTLREGAPGNPTDPTEPPADPLNE